VPRDIAQIREKLETAFPITADMMVGQSRKLEHGKKESEDLQARFAKLHGLQLEAEERIDWEPAVRPGYLFGTVFFVERRQPFLLRLRSLQGRAMIDCISPVGRVGDYINWENEREQLSSLDVRVTIAETVDDSYNVTTEREILLGTRETTDKARVAWLIRQVTLGADQLELDFIGGDRSLELFRDDLEREV
jgi:hypothetical protein